MGDWLLYYAWQGVGLAIVTIAHMCLGGSIWDDLDLRQKAAAVALALVAWPAVLVVAIVRRFRAPRS